MFDRIIFKWLISSISLKILASLSHSNAINVNNAGNCVSDRIIMPPFENICPSSSTQSCQTIELNSPFCNDLPCTGALKMDIIANVHTPRENCCRHCSCYGDPHCESFTGEEDLWIICDARKMIDGRCGMNRFICEQQTDYRGNQCIWLPNNNHNWNIRLNGSPCVFDATYYERGGPELLMYSADDFSFKIILGERGIITEALIEIDVDQRTGSKQTFNMTAEKCFENATWGFNEIQFNRLRSIRIMNRNNDIRWEISDSVTGIVINILCTRNSPASRVVRLNIEDLLEPLNPGFRQNPSGFCMTGVIDKGQGSRNIVRSERHWRRDNIRCSDDGGNDNDQRINFQRAICRNVDSNCKQTWCSSIANNVTNCITSVETNGFLQTWCAYHTSNTHICNEYCRSCVHEFSDFGIVESMEKWSNFYRVLGNEANEVSGVNQCLTAGDIKLNNNDCGLKLQYFKNNNWVTYATIPYENELCNNTASFNSHDDPELFTNNVRLEQCNSCATLHNACRPYPTYESRIIVKKAPDMCPCEYESQI